MHCLPHVCFIYQNILEIILYQFIESLIFLNVRFNIIFKKKNFLHACPPQSEILFPLFIFNKFIYLFIYLFLAALGLGCCTQAFSSCGERGLLFIAVHGLLIVVTSLVAEHGL